MATTSAQVQQLYVSLLGRAADQTGLNYWLNQLNTVPASLTLDQLRANIVNSQPEYAAIYGGLSRADTVAKIYVNLFGHAGDAPGLAYWTTGGGANVSIDQLQVALVNGANTTNGDSAIVANKVLVSDIYTAAAGTNYTAADAAAIIAGVTASTATVTAAVGKLSDGSLAGIAIPAALAQVKALAVADKALADFEAGNASGLTALQASLVALNTKFVADGGTDAALAALTPNADGSPLTYQQAIAALANATKLATAVGTVDTAQTALTTATTTLAADKTALVALGAQADTLIANYNAAFAANAALKAPATADVNVATGSVQASITAKADVFTADLAAYAKATAGDTNVPTITDAASLYTAITGANAASQAKLDAAFGNLDHYSDLKALGQAAAAKAAAEAALNKAITSPNDPVTGVPTSVGTKYDTDSQALAAKNALLADAQAAAALVKQAAAIQAGHDSAQAGADNALSAVNSSAHDVSGTAAGGVVAGDAKADLFYFSALKDSNDFSITNFNKGDGIYVGEGYTLNTTATLDSTGHIVGGDNSAKEVFFFKDATSGLIKAVIETTATGSGNAAPNLANAAGDNVAIITLTGITNLSDVSFSNGVITSNHVAA